MDIRMKRKAIEDMCNLNQIGYINKEVFKMGYSIETASIYGMLAAYNGKVKANQLLKMYDPHYESDPEVEEQFMHSLWALYRDGFIELSTLTDECVEELSEQLGMDTLTQNNTK